MLSQTVLDAVSAFDLTDPAVLQDPYPALAALREAAPVIWYEPSHQWLVTRHGDVHAALRDRRMGRTYEHRYSHAEFARPEPDPRWDAFRRHERLSGRPLEGKGRAPLCPLAIRKRSDAADSGCHCRRPHHS